MLALPGIWWVEFGIGLIVAACFVALFHLEDNV